MSKSMGDRAPDQPTYFDAGQADDDLRGFVLPIVITSTFDIRPTELYAMAEGDPVMVRSRDVDGRTLFNWGDALLVSAIMTRLDPIEADNL